VLLVILSVVFCGLAIKGATGPQRGGSRFDKILETQVPLTKKRLKT
jgi:hypothetical protein